MGFSRKIKEQVVTALEIPRDLAFQETLITITGKYQVLVENYKSIGKLTGEEIIILCMHGRIRLLGKHMKIVHYTPYEMLINGQISEIIL